MENKKLVEAIELIKNYCEGEDCIDCILCVDGDCILDDAPNCWDVDLIEEEIE